MNQKTNLYLFLAGVALIAIAFIFKPELIKKFSDEETIDEETVEEETVEEETVEEEKKPDLTISKELDEKANKIISDELEKDNS